MVTLPPWKKEHINVRWQPGWEGVWGRMDTCICMAESLCCSPKIITTQGERERWRRNRTGRSLPPSQIPQKNISTLSKLHKTTSVGWQRTSGNQKSRPLSSKTGRGKNIKDEKGDKGGGEGAPFREGKPIPGREFEEERFPNTRKHSPCWVCGEPWKHRGQHNRKEKWINN